MKATILNNLNNDQFIEEKIPEVLQQPKEKVNVVNATDNNYRNIKPSGRKSKLQEEDTSRNTKAPKKSRMSEKQPDPSTRFDYSLGHFPLIDRSRRVRCKNKECDQKSYIFCSVCEVHLCICLNENRNCFTEYHTIKK